MQCPLRAIKEAKRITPLQIDPSNLKDYSGVYHSDELATEYRAYTTDNKLIMVHMRLGEFDLTSDPVTSDLFSGRVGTIQFVRDAKRKVTGLMINGDRVKNLRFDRIAHLPAEAASAQAGIHKDNK